MEILAGYDNRSVLYDAGEYVLRKFNADYYHEIAAVYDIYKECHLDQFGIVATEIDNSTSSLRHKKHVISYPYEWTANMFKDAVLFHLRLFAELDKNGLTFKDALPNNILFHHCEPVFVDFSSLVRKDKLQDEQWLVEGSRYSDPRYEVVKKMLTPFMLIPFIAIARNEYAQARVLLSEKACNCVGGTPNWKDLDIDTIATLYSVSPLRSLINIVMPVLPKNSKQIITLRGILDTWKRGEFRDYTDRILEFIASIDVTPPKSAYLSYYEDKNENLDFDKQSSWNNKQKNVYSIVDLNKPVTVLDIGANTGWFSILSAKLGANVVAVDIDESSIDSLYLYAKDNKLPILPLLMPFDGLTREIYGVEDPASICQGRDLKTTPLFLPATRRLKSDMVLCLGLLHHLILGMGKTVDEVFRILSDVTGSLLVLEYVDLEDDLIKAEPTFFKNLENAKHNYHLDYVVEVGKKYFSKVEKFSSHPETRMLLVFLK
jgi:SAM-dependent methyltransferase